ncbi:alpha/beta hydrolase [Halosquirtibacter laminarini]|uniref:Alpha/beta hydrolase n=1 Tax=Halosquirtibacter laminarini TaxID=3374600 RepID=A0AC61NPS3_9BACT|nr:alpha/beta hydrolase [Prolixibacteraceae bacterium]
MQNSSKLQLFTICLLILMTGCSSELEEPIDTEGIMVMANATYPVVLHKDIAYGFGLTQKSMSSKERIEKPLLLDIYTPENKETKRPLFIFIHGGGFKGGSKDAITIKNLADYFTSRGWVFVSPSYRLQNDFGTVPQEWKDTALQINQDTVSQFNAMYTAVRDTKAACRWVMSNANSYGIDTNNISIGGSSAGAITAIAVAISEQEDFRDELSIAQDPTLKKTHLDQSIHFGSIIDLWGSSIALGAHEMVYQTERFDVQDPPLFIFHGTKDLTVPFIGAQSLKKRYTELNIPYAFYPIEGGGHGVWNTTYEGKTLEELAFQFIVEQHNLKVK